MNTPAKVLALACGVEASTGLAAMVVPAIVIALVFGFEASADGLLLARCFGIAVFALALACWPGQQTGPTAFAFWAMFLYNVLFAVFLNFMGAFAHIGGVLLWPAAWFHALVAIAMLWTRRRDH